MAPDEPIVKSSSTDANDEDLLALKTLELEAFGGFDDSFHRFVLNFESHAPCALHSWGSQLVGCECGCRTSGLSEHRLREKGLFGCLIKSCQTDLKNSLLRHLHPNEVMMLCAFDPMIDFGCNPRLTLAAAGQMASPLQAAWIFAALDERIQLLHGMPVHFGSEARIQAYVTWILMRGRQVWPAVEEPISDSKTVSLMNFWEEVGHMSLHELMHPPNWPALHPHDINIATVLDHLICRKQDSLSIPAQISKSHEDIAMTLLDDDTADHADTPCFETPQSLSDVLPEGSPDECLVIFHHEFTDPIKVKVNQGSTLQHFLDAHENLVGGVHAVYATDRFGQSIPFSHVLQLGQVICICCEECVPVSPNDPITEYVAGDADVTELAVSTDNAVPACVQPCLDVSPTAPWTHPVQEAFDAQLGHFGPCDAGECAIPMQRLPDCESWISAAPLLGLVGDQFKSLHVPVVVNTQHLWALKHQLLRAEDRVTILKHQEGIWSDDEFRFHISNLLQIRNERMLTNKELPIRQHFMLDPLLLTGWIHHGAHLCHLWGQAHPEIRSQNIVVLSACMVAGHWIPVVLDPQGGKLHFTTWDAPQNDHSALNHVIEQIGKALGFEQVVGLRHQRLFFASERCGALAMAFLHHSALASMLPTCNAEAEAIHQGYRNSFEHAVSTCQLARRPWIWGSGDAEDTPFVNEPGTSSVGPDPMNPVPIDLPDACRSHQCITKEERLHLLREKGKKWGDDEIRFHLMNMINHPNNVCNQPFSSIPGVFMLDPLMLTTWDTIGKKLCETWCQRHMTVPSRGFHVIMVLLQDEHWFPVWFVPHGRIIVVHLIDDGIIEPQVIQPMLDVFQEQFAFEEAVLHTYPSQLPPHEMCGAAAIAFLGHVIVGADLPFDLEALGDLHSNMKASFVQALYEGQCCICPVAWGAGGTGSLVKSLAAELCLHGVPDDKAEQRAQQAIRTLGSEQVMNALSSKNVWRSLKILGNNMKFHFLMPDELQQLASSNKNAPVGKKLRKGPPKSKPAVPEMVDPSKLRLPEGAFQAKGQVVPQIALQQLGPIAHGIALASFDDALPYLRAGKLVSGEPLAIAVFSPPRVTIESVLPHTKVLVPCVCVVNNEPILTEATIVQLGSGFVEKTVVPTAISLDQLDVVTIKIMVYKDEHLTAWDEFISAPIKNLVKVFPILKRCSNDACECPAWHNSDDLPLRDPIMDVWRRQYLNHAFKPVAANKADIFSVCLRVPAAIMSTLLTQSGTAGAYTEPRTPDGKAVLSQYVVVWASKLSQSELAHVRQTNPVVVGMARLGEHAQTIHDVLRPESAFLPSGPKSQYVVGPFPWGSDRNAITKAMKQAGWAIKALQPTQPIAGRGSMWLIQAVESPPCMIFHMAHGEVVVSKHKAPEQVKPAAPASVGSASTLTLCSAGGSDVSNDNDPWLQADPWGSYNRPTIAAPSTGAQAGLQQLEDRIQNAVLAKLPSSMDDDVPERILTLETQVQQLMVKSQALEGQFSDFTSNSNKQFAVVQQQIQQQSQTFHGQMESHTQSVQAMFESQMHQIRNLLTKRPRDDNGME